MSYLDSPRLNFKGYFQADVSTVNNKVDNYDIETFDPKNQELHPDYSKTGNWNPVGTGIFRLIDCRVTGGCLDGRALASTDPVMGMLLENAEQRVSGKLVDLDPQQQMVSQIWGMKVRLAQGNNLALFDGEYEPAAFINLWERQQNISAPDDQTLAAVYQSILRNVHWHGHGGSALLEALQQASAEGGLSINMNVYGYGRDPNIPRYTLGHVVGSIGPYRPEEPKHFVLGRQMIVADDVSDVYSFAAKVDEKKHIVSADFGNSLQIINADGGLVDIGPLTLAICKNQTPGVLAQIAQDQVEILGELNYQQADWYAQTAGIQEFDYSANPWAVANINSYPLLLLGTPANGAYPVKIQESLDGLYVRADNFVCRINPGEKAEVDLYASCYGQPLPQADVSVYRNKGMIGVTGTDGDKPVPVTCVPTDAISYPTQVKTDPHGKAVLEIRAAAEGPGNPRGYIDGQLYGIGYSLVDQPQNYIANSWNFISTLIFDLTEVPEQPTWYRDIQPIFKQFGNLYPIMSKHLVDLGNYDSVIKHLKILDLAFSLPVENPNYMPVTRDLSDQKREMILKWMRSPGEGGLPLLGQPEQLKAAPRALSTTMQAPLELEPMQRGGKTEILLQFAANQQADRSNKP